MDKVINFKSNKNLMALQTTNSFGDQIIAIIDISKQNDTTKDSDFPYYSGKIVSKEVFPEGNWIDFIESNFVITD